MGTLNSAPDQTQENSTAPPHIPPSDNIDRGEPDKGIQPPNTEIPATPSMSHTTAPPRSSAGSPSLSAVIPPTGDPEKEIIIAVIGVTGNTHKYSKRVVR